MRARVAIISAVLFTIPLVFPVDGMLQASCIRVGVLMAVFWLSFNEVMSLPPWLLRIVLIAAAIVAIRPKLLLFILPVILVLAVIRPKRKRVPCTS